MKDKIIGFVALGCGLLSLLFSRPVMGNEFFYWTGILGDIILSIFGLWEIFRKK